MDVEDARTVGARLRQIRHSRRKSLRVVAGLAKMSKSRLSQIERGESALDRRSEIVALADALQIAPSELVTLPMPTPGNGVVDAGVTALRLVIQRASFDSPGGYVLPVELLQQRVHSVLAAQNHCEHEAVGVALPALVADLHTSVAAGRDVAELLRLAALLHVNGTHSWLRLAGANNDLCFDAARLGREFGPASVGVWRMSVALENGDHSRAAAMAETIRPESLVTPTRRAAYWTGYGRALARVRGRDDEAVIAFRRAETISPGKVLRNPFARDLIAELLARRSRRDAVGRELRGMAYRAGLPV